jgi:hypothetical protein
MSNFKRKADGVDIQVKALNAQKAWLSSALGFDRAKDKWKDFKGPNPLMMMGLDRS